MILCVTLNPCLDKTLTVPAWKPGDNIRGRAVRDVVGGKGNNVARALKRLGRDVRPVTFLGGDIGTRCERLLRSEDGFDPIVTPTTAETRVILTVRTDSSANQTAFFDPDPAITPAEAEAFLHRIEGSVAVGGVDAITLSGSSPSPATHELFSDLIALSRARKIPVFLDTYGPALRAIWAFWPNAIQLNRREAAGHLGTSEPSEAGLLALLRDWERRGVASAIVTDGPSPALARIGGQTFRVTPPAIDPVNPIGSGDCLLAGTVDATLEGFGPEKILRHAFACAVANALVWDAGAIDPATVAGLEERISVEAVSR
jgi:1-phosphofructokinase family hexose kinase